MSTVNNHRVVIRRKKVKGGGHHGGSWKIAYADFITAMMAFFLVMWLISIVPREELKGIAEYFRMPLRVAIMGGPNNSAETSAVPGEGRIPCAARAMCAAPRAIGWKPSPWAMPSAANSTAWRT